MGRVYELVGSGFFYSGLGSWYDYFWLGWYRATTEMQGAKGLIGITVFGTIHEAISFP